MDEEPFRALSLSGHIIHHTPTHTYTHTVHFCLTWLAPFSPEVRSDVKDAVMKTLLMETALIHL